MLLGWILATAALADDGWSWRGRLGAQIDAGTRGLSEFEFRRGDVTLALFTNALDVRWTPSTDRGRGWVGARLEPVLAGLFFARWTDGAPDPTRSVYASAFGADAGYVVYLPHGLYAGGQVLGQIWHLPWPEDSAVDAPVWQPRLLADGLFGYWSEPVHVWVRAGVDGLAEGASPHVHLSLQTALPWPVRPTIGLRAGWADGATDIVKTRIGGVNPYEVPLAGAVWAEIWTESYAALRVGPEFAGARGRLAWTTSLVVDLVAHDEGGDVGVAGNARFAWGPRWLEVAVGSSPTLPRPGIVPLSAFVRIGQDWTPLRRRPRSGTAYTF